MATAPLYTMQPRTAPSRPLRLGTRRRKSPPAISAVPQAGASRFGGAEAPSLDTEKQLATTVFEWNRNQSTEADLRREQEILHTRLRQTVFEIFQKHCARPADDGQAVWWDAYETAKKALPEEKESDRWKRVEKWLKKNKPTGRNADVLKWEKIMMQLERCQQEWIGYRAACCGERSGVIAVPIGCNHRLCPFCAWRRSQQARVKIKTMYDRLTHPIFITLTIPNQASIRKHDYTLFRQRVRAFLAQYKGFIQGGVYSIETTYNRLEQTWHIHAHILADASSPLPSTAQKMNIHDTRSYAFNVIKYRMEFDWLRLWSRSWGKKLPDFKVKNNHRTTNVQALMMLLKMEREEWEEKARQDRDEFAHWVSLREANRVQEYSYTLKKHVPISGLSDAEIAKRTAWNQRNSRVIDVRPVNDRDKAAKEVLKYITKAADFCDVPDAVEQFCDAVKGARLIQTFGSWYGAKFDTVFDPAHMDDWGEMKCTCGLNMWERMGVFYRHDVEMSPDGRWHLKRPHDHNSAGTVPRPMIRALGAKEEENFRYVWQPINHGRTQGTGVC